METKTKEESEDLIKYLNSAIKRLGMYPPFHPATQNALEKPWSIINELFQRKDSLTLSVAENRLVFEGKILDEEIFTFSFVKSLKEQNIESITFKKGLKKDELGWFLNFFVKDFEDKDSKKNLSLYLKEKGVETILVNQFRFELVSEKDKVVSAEMVENMDLKLQVSDILKNHPELIIDIFSDSPLNQQFLKDNLNITDVKEFRKRIKDEVKNFTEDEVLALLSSALKLSLEQTEKEPAIGKTLSLIENLLKEKDKKKILPQMKRILSESGIMEEKYFDLLMEENPRLEKISELLDKLECGQYEQEHLVLLVKKLGMEESNLKDKIIDRLFDGVKSENQKVREGASWCMMEILKGAIVEKRGEDFVYIKEKVLSDFPLAKDAETLKSYLEILSVLAREMIQRKELGELKDLMDLVFSLKEEKNLVNLVGGFVKSFSEDETIASLTDQMIDTSIQKPNKTVEEILLLLDTEKVAKKLTEIFTVDDRNLRVLCLRILPQLKNSSFSVLAELLENENNFRRKFDSGVLVDDSWYKARNALFVLGNLKDPKSLAVLEKLNSDPDLRVRTEVWNTLEKLGEISFAIQMQFLMDPDKGLRRKAANLLMLQTEKDYIPDLIEIFEKEQADKPLLLSVIGKMGGRDAKEFLENVALEQNKSIVCLSKKQKEELKLSALEFLQKIGDEQTKEKLEELLKEKRRGFRVLLGKDKIQETMEKVVNHLKTTLD
jgi:hypothetical protein